MGLQTVPLSFLLRESQAAVVDRVFRDWWPHLTGDQLGAADKTLWRLDNQVILCGVGQATLAGKAVFTFDHQGFDPDESDWRYGPTQVISTGIDPRPDKTYLFDNTTGTASLDIDLAETVTLTDTASTSTDTKLTIDVTATEKATIGGSEVGGSLEAEVAEHLGITRGAAKSRSATQSHTASVGLKTSVPVGKATLATLGVPETTSRQPFTINGVWLSSLAIAASVFPKTGREQFFPLWDNIDRFRQIYQPRLSEQQLQQMTWPDLDDFAAAVTGHNPDFPHVGNADFGVVAALDAARRILWSGRQTLTEQANGSYRFRDVTDDPHGALRARIVTGH